MPGALDKLAGAVYNPRATMNRLKPNRRSVRDTAAAFLQADLPVPQRSDDEVAAEVERNFHWNYAVNLADAATYFFGLSFISASTIAPLFVSKLSPNPLPIGLLAVISQGGWYLPQLFTANLVERIPRRKPVAVRAGFFLERLPIWLPVLAALVAVRSPGLALVLFLGGYAWRVLGGGAVAPAWQDLIARCFPVQWRGRFLGIAFFVGTGMGAAGAALSTWILETREFSTNFVILFAIAAVSLTLGWFALSLTREPVPPPDPRRQSSREFLTNLPDIVRCDHNFSRFLVARSMLALGSLGVGFVTVSAIQRWQVPDGAVGLYTICSLVGQAAGNLGFGLLADRYGHKLSLELGALASVMAFCLAWLAPSPAWIYAVFFLLGIALGATLVSGILVVMEFCEPQRRPTYVGLANTLVGLVSVTAPLLGTWLATVDYGWLFATSAAINLAALVAMRWGVCEPRWATRSHTRTV